MISLKKNSITISNLVSKEILLYTHGHLEICYISSRQTSSTTITLTVKFKSELINDYTIRFMSVLGELYDNQVDSDIRNMCEIINDFMNISYNSNSLFSAVLNSFKSNLAHLMEGTSFKRQKELLDFDDPEVWKKSEEPEARCNMDYLNHVKSIREVHDNLQVSPTKISY